MSSTHPATMGLRKAGPAPSGNQGNVKKLVIKPLKCKRIVARSQRAASTRSYAILDSCAAAKPELPENFEEVTWAKLQDAVQAVHNKRPVSCSLEELYSVREACTARLREAALQTGAPRLTMPRPNALPRPAPLLLHALQAVQDMCMHKMAGKLYQQLQQVRKGRKLSGYLWSYVSAQGFKFKSSEQQPLVQWVNVGWCE